MDLLHRLLPLNYKTREQLSAHLCLGKYGHLWKDSCNEIKSKGRGHLILLLLLLGVLKS